ncbi:MAG: hypothetical protein ABIW36_08230 [Terrimesophilobacter sp.]
MSIPFVGESGTKEYAHFLIGPASQSFSTPVDGTPDEEEDKNVLMKLERTTRALQPGRPMWFHEMTDVPELSDYLDAFGVDKG